MRVEQRLFTKEIFGLGYLESEEGVSHLCTRIFGTHGYQDRLDLAKSLDRDFGSQVALGVHPESGAAYLISTRRDGFSPDQLVRIQSKYARFLVPPDGRQDLL